MLEEWGSSMANVEESAGTWFDFLHMHLGTLQPSPPRQTTSIRSFPYYCYSALFLHLISTIAMIAIHRFLLIIIITISTGTIIITNIVTIVTIIAVIIIMTVSVTPPCALISRMHLLPRMPCLGGMGTSAVTYWCFSGSGGVNIYMYTTMP